MLVRNNLDTKVIVNRYNRDELIDFRDPNNYNLNGIEIGPRATIELNVGPDDVLFVSNFPKTLAKYITLYTEPNSDLNIWGNVSDLVRCQQLGESQGIKCKNTINLVLKPKLHNLLIWKMYNCFTYLFFAMIVALAVSAAIFLGTFLI